MDLVHGVDVSKYEPQVNWRVLRANGYRFAFVRATFGIGYVDETFRSHWEGARREGILRGAYHYLIAGQDARQQADLFISTVGEDQGELPPVVDLEDHSNDNESNSRIISSCKALLDRIEQAFGKKPIIYSRSQFLKDRVSLSGRAPMWAKDYPLWLAQYPFTFSAATMPNKNMPTQAKGWADWMFWQYSDKAIIEGVADAAGRPTACDLNWFRGTEDELYAFAGVRKNEPLEYVVRQGDTIRSIAEQHDITVDEILNSNPNLAPAGTKLIIPIPTISKPADTGTGTGTGSGTGGGSTPTPARTHVVQAGENLGVIAIKYRVTVDAIMAINPQITNRNFIFPNQVIVIP